MSGLDFELDRDRGVLRVSPRTPLEKTDFAALGEAVDGYLGEGGALSGLIIDAGRFPGWDDLGAFLAHLRFVRAHHTLIPKVAVVSDDWLLSAMPGIAGHFVAAEVRHFAVAERDSAAAWITSLSGE